MTTRSSAYDCSAGTAGGRSLRPALVFAWALTAIVWTLPSAPVQAGTLEFFEASVGPDVARTFSPPVDEALIEICYGASSAEGGGLYGFSEILIAATGDLELTTTGFSCMASNCLFSPSPFVSGSSLRVTAGEDLTGEFGGTTNLITVSVSGTNGHVVVTRGEYLDASDPALGVGAIQQVETAIVATVPEPSAPTALAAGALLLGLLGASQRARERSLGRPRRTVRSDTIPAAAGLS
ncbi:MAG: hypothetical protein JRG86_04905 [Deltaproteobacteria bacterium]|jgi:hypothetical protein|nr:hypothetical protein [Deltaproteobacteria bacterium]